MKTKAVKSSNTLSTKEVIIKESLALINENGMMDFRIDVLAMALNLSPGNITYHFAKKEDISIALWSRFVDEFKMASVQVSALLDIKQSFLILKNLYSIINYYRGVVMFVNSNIRLIKDPAYNGGGLKDIIDMLFDNLAKTLYNNGYITSNERTIDTKRYQSIIMQWALNKSIIKNSDSGEDSIKNGINQDALLILFSFYNVMNDTAKKEYKYIRMRVAKGDI